MRSCDHFGAIHLPLNSLAEYTPTEGRELMKIDCNIAASDALSGKFDRSNTTASVAITKCCHVYRECRQNRESDPRTWQKKLSSLGGALLIALSSVLLPVIPSCHQILTSVLFNPHN